MKLSSEIILLAISSLFLFQSCREEIIPPDNFSGNVNEPQQLVAQNSYTFIINADNITIEHSGDTYFNTNSALILFNITGYEQGTAIFRLLDSSGNIIYTRILNSNLDLEEQVLNSAVPSKVQIIFNSFTGKVKLELLPIF
ncbi:MAG: hypothetical protein Kow0098_13790 [Ignavibacteriaceae bacterium]